MELNVGMGGQELSHGLGLCAERLSAMTWDLLAWGLRGHDICEKRQRTAQWRVALGRFAQDLSAGKLPVRLGARHRTMPQILKAVALGTPGRKGQNRIQPIESLNGALFIDAEHCSVGRRLEVEVDRISAALDSNP